MSSNGDEKTIAHLDGWDPLASLTDHANLGGMPSMAHHFNNSPYQTGHYPSDSGTIDKVPKIPMGFGNQSFSLNPIKTNELQEHVNDKKQKFKNDGVNLSGKKYKDNSPCGDVVHVRAKRGQAINSHSLAERVRREKISERMKMLQGLVPGCNKITGKAVMLDEIINYIQSLQQQVEFLSMKLANVNREFNVDINQLLSKNILHSSNTSILGSSPVTNSSHPYSHGIFHGTIPCSTSHIHPMLHQAAWDTELQRVFHMDYAPNPANNNIRPNEER